MGRARIGSRRGPTSRQGGEPVVLDAAGPDARARQLTLGVDHQAPRRPTIEIMAGVVHVPGWLGTEAQRELAVEFRSWAQAPAGLRHPRVPGGHLMSVQSVCLGWHWYPYAYTRNADDTDGAPVKALPRRLAALARRAVADAYGADAPEAARFVPDAAIVNRYPPGAKLGLHQDGEEPSDAPVVTIAIGDTGIFRFAGIDRRTGPFVDVEMRSGDLLVFGRENRRVLHGVPKVLERTGPDGIGLPPGRLSITVRETGL